MSGLVFRAAGGAVLHGSSFLCAHGANLLNERLADGASITVLKSRINHTIRR